jgi:hypothetical protein
MTEHWSLLGARSLVYTEAMSRTSIFVAALTGSVVALALVAQATDFETGFVAFALVLLPVVYFLGVVTIVRLAQVSREDALWVQGMNRIRNAYLDMAPELDRYFVTSHYDDDLGILQSSVAMRSPPPPTQAFVAVPGVVAVIDSVVAGAIAGIAGIGLDLGTAAALILGIAFFVISLACFIAWATRGVARYRSELASRFPSPRSNP